MQRLLVLLATLPFATGCIDLDVLSRNYVPVDASSGDDLMLTDQSVADANTEDLGAPDAGAPDQSMSTDDLALIDDLAPPDLAPPDLAPLQCSVGTPLAVDFNGLIDSTMGVNIASIGDDQFLLAAVVNGNVKLAKVTLGSSQVSVGGAAFVCSANATCVSPRIARAESTDTTWNVGVHAGAATAIRLIYTDLNSISSTSSAACSTGVTPKVSGADAVQAGETSALFANCNDEFQIVPAAGLGLPSIHSGSPVAEVRVARPANSTTKAIIAYTNASVTTATSLNLTTMAMANLAPALTGTALLSGLALDVFPTNTPSVVLAGAPTATNRLRIFLAEPTLQTAVEVDQGASSPFIVASANAPVGVAASPDIALVTYQTSADAAAVPITPAGEARRAFVLAAGGKHPQIAWGTGGFAAVYITASATPSVEVVSISCPPGL